MTRHTAETITDPALDDLYRKLTQIRAIAGEALIGMLRFPQQADTEPVSEVQQLREQLAAAEERADRLDRKLATMTEVAAGNRRSYVSTVKDFRATEERVRAVLADPSVLDWRARIRAALDGTEAAPAPAATEATEGVWQGRKHPLIEASAREVVTDRATIREQRERPTHPDGTPYRYHEIKAEGWGHCDGCGMWSTATPANPHQCKGPNHVAPKEATP